jgi:hypothetical protein
LLEAAGAPRSIVADAPLGAAAVARFIPLKCHHLGQCPNAKSVDFAARSIDPKRIIIIIVFKENIICKDSFTKMIRKGLGPWDGGFMAEEGKLSHRTLNQQEEAER